MWIMLSPLLEIGGGKLDDPVVYTCAGRISSLQNINGPLGQCLSARGYSMLYRRSRSKQRWKIKWKRNMPKKALYIRSYLCCSISGTQTHTHTTTLIVVVVIITFPCGALLLEKKECCCCFVSFWSSAHTTICKRYYRSVCLSIQRETTHAHST